jgi:hypothetical protein
MRLRSQKTFLIFFVLSTVCCSDQGVSPEHGWSADHSDIQDPQSRWQAYGIHDYSMLQSRNCFCPDGGTRYLITVQKDAVTRVINPADGSVLPAGQWARFKTVVDLFALVKSIDTATVASIQVSYNARYGFPERVFVNPSANIADEEYGFKTDLLQP